jgi:hypothetical protein
VYETDKQVINRQKAGLLKLSMIFAVSEWREGRLIRVSRANVARAVGLLAQSIAYTKQVQDFAYTTDDTKVYTKVMDLVRGANKHEITLSKLSDKMYRRGIRDTRHMEAVLGMLKQSGHIKVETRLSTSRGGPRPTYIVWTPRRIPTGVLLRKEKEESDGEETHEK